MIIFIYYFFNILLRKNGSI